MSYFYYAGHFVGGGTCVHCGEATPTRISEDPDEGVAHTCCVDCMQTVHGIDGKRAAVLQQFAEEGHDPAVYPLRD